jgi:DNA uptake protein ComE-like DNA-binding protein
MVENLEEVGIALGGQHASDAERSHREAARPGSENGSKSGERPESRKGSGSAKSDGKSTRTVDINQANAEELQQAFQVDGERAEYLVNRRRELGGFSSWEQIKDEVPTFEDKMVQHLEQAGFTMMRTDQKPTPARNRAT